MKPFNPTYSKLPGLIIAVALYAALLACSEYLFDGESITGFFEPACGVALAAVIIGGWRYLWTIFIGGILAHIIIGEYWGNAIPEIMADTLQAAFGAWLLERNKFDWRLPTLQSYFNLVLLGGGVSTAVGMAAVVPGLMVFGVSDQTNILDFMQRWWMGDALGIILVTPLIFVWWREGFSFQNTREAASAIVLAGMTVLVGQVVFLDWMHGYLGDVAKSYWMFLFIAWGAIAAGQRWVTFSLLIVAIQALWGAMLGVGSFAHDIAETHLMNFWFYCLILSLVGMSLACYFSELKQAKYEVSLRDSLIREIHHRIKNNLHGVSGLLSLLAGRYPELASPIENTIGQLKSIAAIHGVQARGTSSEVFLQDMVQAVANSVSSLWQLGIDISMSKDGVHYTVKPQEVVPLSLIINELLSNAVKHGSKPGHVRMSIEPGIRPDSLRVMVINAGTLNEDLESRMGTGLQLVKSLMPRLGASLSWQSHDGSITATLDLEFPVITPEGAE